MAIRHCGYWIRRKRGTKIALSGVLVLLAGRLLSHLRFPVLVRSPFI